MKIYDSKRQDLIEFKPIKNNEVSMYVCGPTIYSDIHIGNARPLIFFDVVARYLKKIGYNVKYVSNITDIDDKIINKASELGITEQELVDKNYKEYKKICKQLRINDFYEQPRVTEYMPEITNYIKKLVDSGHAYLVDGDVYFDTSSVCGYGDLSKIKMEEQKVADRIEMNSKKRNPADFTLWKKTKEGIKFESPFGMGRPGWHTECVVMINEILGNQIDIHGGGIDLKFPHHENENAQSCACTGELANYWMHNGFINLDNEKMSKSIGNTILVKDIASQIGVNQLRLLMLQTNYRQPININENFLKQTQIIDDKLEKLYLSVADVKVDATGNNFYINQLNDALAHDFSTANLITKLISYSKIKLNDEIAQAILYGLDILGLEYKKEELSIPKEISDLIEKRNQKKEEKNYDEADRIRVAILQMGYEIKDTREGVVCKMVKK